MWQCVSVCGKRPRQKHTHTHHWLRECYTLSVFFWGRLEGKEEASLTLYSARTQSFRAVLRLSSSSTIRPRMWGFTQRHLLKITCFSLSGWMHVAYPLHGQCSNLLSDHKTSEWLALPLMSYCYSKVKTDETEMPYYGLCSEAFRQGW